MLFGRSFRELEVECFVDLHCFAAVEGCYADAGTALIKGVLFKDRFIKSSFLLETTPDEITGSDIVWVPTVW